VKYINYVRHFSRIILLDMWVNRRNKIALIKIGDGYGSYRFPISHLNKLNSAWMVGAGENLTLDLFLASQGLDMTIIDPTPRAIAYAKNNTCGIPNVRIIGMGLWIKTGYVDFFLPRNSEHVSLSITNIQNTESKVSLPVITYSDLSEKLNHYPDIIKLDVEGAAIPIILSILENKNLPNVILVEFEPSWNFLEMISLQIKLKLVGYQFICRDQFDCVYIIEKTL
jgi:FkbM family methyltransferase